MRLNLVYITARDREEAERIGRALVQSRLAAGANVFGGVRSIYWWQGKVQEESEAVLIAKAKESLVPALIEMVKAIHSYSVPCVLALPLLDGNKDFLDWIEGETR